MYRLLADLVLITHAAFIGFVVFGLLMIVAGGALGWGWVRRPVFRLAHLGAILYVVIQAWFGVMCPLTTLESTLRERAGQDPYAPDGFIAHWLRSIIFFEASPWVFTVIYTLFGLLVAATLVWVPIRWPNGPHRAPAAG